MFISCAMQTTPITIRKLQIEDLETALALSTDASWNQTAQDWKFLLEDSRNICVAAVSAEGVVGTTIALDYDGKLAWIGMVLVNKAYRGRGISKLLLQYVFDNYKAALKLDATALGEPVYTKLGFLPEYTIARMVNPKLEHTLRVGDMVAQPLSPKQLTHIREFDAIVSGVQRKNLLKYFYGQYPHKSWILLDVNRVDGFTLGRDGCRYHHIGPVLATSTQHAIALVSQALQPLVGQAVVIDVPTDKKELIQFLQSNGFTEQRQFKRMYKEQNPFPGNPDFLFAIAGPEFG